MELGLAQLPSAYHPSRCDSSYNYYPTKHERAKLRYALKRHHRGATGCAHAESVDGPHPARLQPGLADPTRAGEDNARNDACGKPNERLGKHERNCHVEYRGTVRLPDASFGSDAQVYRDDPASEDMGFWVRIARRLDLDDRSELRRY
jgi:hypothetical protein